MLIRLTILTTFFMACLITLLMATAPVQASQTDRVSSPPSILPQTPANPACLDISDEECDALNLLFIQTQGVSWTNNSGWFSSPKPCDWYGITCRTIDKTTHIERIDLSWNHLQGSIPMEIGKLSGLRLLDLSENQLEDSLPVSLSNLSQLQFLDLSNNQLGGKIPAEIGNLSQLKVLNLSENKLAGQLPDTLGNLTMLESFHLFENGFSGDLPLTLPALTKLHNLKFQNTHLCIPNDQALEKWLDGIYYLSRTTASDCQSVNQTPRPLVLIYAVLDNDLSSEWGRLVNNAEQGVRSGAFDVKLMVDAKGTNNSYEYTLEQNSDENCPSLVTGDFDCDRYQWRRTLRQSLENSAQRDALISFVTNALIEYPESSHVVLSLVGHGSGWGANALPIQPKGWRELSEVITDTMGGMLWDDVGSDGVTETRSLSTQALGSALRQIKAQTGRTIDLLYLDACSMAMAEVAYEVRGTVQTLLASENTKWATFPYDLLLPSVETMSDGRTLGERWIDAEVRILQQSPGHAFTYSLIDISKIASVVTATSQLADALRPLLSTKHLQVLAAYSQTSHFESNYDGAVDGADSFVDLSDFAEQLKTTFAGEQAVVSAAQAVQSAVQSAVIRTVYDDTTSDQTTPQPANWSALGGLSVYLPVATDEEKRSELYNATHLDWAELGSWDEFLADYWSNVNGTGDMIDISKCQQTSECPSLNGWGSFSYTPTVQIFLPTVLR